MRLRPGSHGVMASVHGIHSDSAKKKVPGGTPKDTMMEPPPPPIGNNGAGVLFGPRLLYLPGARAFRAGHVVDRAFLSCTKKCMHSENRANVEQIGIHSLWGHGGSVHGYLCERPLIWFGCVDCFCTICCWECVIPVIYSIYSCGNIIYSNK